MSNRKALSAHRISNIIYRTLVTRVLEATEITSPEQIRATRRVGVRRGHMVKEWVFTINQNNVKPILVIVRIADTRPSTLATRRTEEEAANEPGRDAAITTFDDSGLPIHATLASLEDEALEELYQKRLLRYDMAPNELEQRRARKALAAIDDEMRRRGTHD